MYFMMWQLGAATHLLQSQRKFIQLSKIEKHRRHRQKKKKKIQEDAKKKNIVEQYIFLYCKVTFLILLHVPRMKYMIFMRGK